MVIGANLGTSQSRVLKLRSDLKRKNEKKCFSIFELVSKCVNCVSKVSKSSYSVQFSVFLIDYGVILSFILSSLATASTADLGNVNTVIFDGESEIFSEKVYLGKRPFGFYKRCTGSLLKSLCSLKVISQPPYWFFFLSIC